MSQQNCTWQVPMQAECGSSFAHDRFRLRPLQSPSKCNWNLHAARRKLFGLQALGPAVSKKRAQVQQNGNSQLPYLWRRLATPLIINDTAYRWQLWVPEILRVLSKICVASKAGSMQDLLSLIRDVMAVELSERITLRSGRSDRSVGAHSHNTAWWVRCFIADTHVSRRCQHLVSAFPKIVRWIPQLITVGWNLRHDVRSSILGVQPWLGDSTAYHYFYMQAIFVKGDRLEEYFQRVWSH